LIESGVAEINILDSTGSNKKICTLGSGQYFGEIALLQSCPRNATVVALENLNCLELTKTLFERFLACVGSMKKELNDIATLRTVDTLKKSGVPFFEGMDDTRMVRRF
jgi:CRP-like cAMP-binding protein